MFFFLVTDTVDSNFKTRTFTIEEHSTAYCGWPFIYSQHNVTSLMECALKCMGQTDCYYININTGDPDDDIMQCHVTSFLATQDENDVTVGNPWEWRSYLVTRSSEREIRPW